MIETLHFFSVGTEIRGIAFSEGTNLKIVVVRVVEIPHRWEEVLRLVVDAIVVPCSTQILVAEVTLVAEAAVAVGIAIVSMVLRSAVDSAAEVEEVAHMIAVAVAGAGVVGGFPTRKAGDFTRIGK